MIEVAKAKKFHFSEEQKTKIESMINLKKPNIIIDVVDYECDMDYGKY